MFGWGNSAHGELGLGGIEEDHIYTPTKLEWPKAQHVIKGALGANHTLLLTDEGQVYSCGSNDYGQLGHGQPRKRPRLISIGGHICNRTPDLVQGLDAHRIISVTCGAQHSMALNEWGQIFTWGSDTYGQLGHQLGQSTQPKPKIVKALAAHHVVQIAAGERHSVALTNGGDIFTWGRNNHSQLGIGTVTPAEISPSLVTSLSGIPIAFITCGANHTFCISKSGTVFGWGKNNYGQLGLNDTQQRAFPTQLRTMRNLKVRYISCGDEFSMFLTLDGGVFTCGAGMYGQLGHGTNSNEILPRQIIELMGSTITQIACGRQHSLAFVPSRGRVYSFGVGGSGQLGLRKPGNATTPQSVLGPWVSPSGVALVPNKDKSNCNLQIQRIFAGGDHCFALVTTHGSKHTPVDFREYEPNSQILAIQYKSFITLPNLAQHGQVDHELLNYLEVIFKSLSCINGSFLKGTSHFYCTSKNHGLDIEEAERTFNTIAKIENTTIKELIWHCILDDILSKLIPSPPDVEALRIYLILPLYHEFNNPKQNPKLHKPFANALNNLKSQAKKVVGIWWSSMSQDYFERLIFKFKSVVSYILMNQKIPPNGSALYDASLLAALEVLTFLNKLNCSVDGLKVPFDCFHINDLGDYLDIRVDYILWLTDQSSGKIFMCDYPFLFDAQAKTRLLETDQSIQMQNAMQNAAQQAMLGFLLNPQTVSLNQFLVLNVTREHIVDDALRELSNVSSADLKKPLKVKFCGEEAEDAGGVRKEFFLLLLREILDPKYGMFKEYEETRAIWFSESSFEEDAVYFLIGLICGLAIYNFTIIDIPFPLALYKKLLNEPIGLSDVKGLSPTMYNSLQSLLDYEDSDFDEVFGLYFEITRELFGEARVIELKPNGSQIKVTQDNKREYVQLYVNYIFNDSVKKQYDAFHSGFMKVVGGRVLSLFHSHELMAVVVGNENYDWHALEEAAEYKNGYSSSDQTIRWFWEVLHEMSLEDKKKFLLFLTGSDRIPMSGMKSIKIIIQPTNDDRFLPVAHTCFNLLDLPRYKTKEKLKYKLMQAIQQTEGFSLI